jgi:hypothetical protein
VTALCAVVPAEDSRWADALTRVPHDVFATPAYHRACETSTGGRALCLVAEDGADVLVHPFLRRPVEQTLLGEEGWSDLESVYGYSGPLGAAISGAWEWFAEWCRAERVLAEFVRFDPALQNEPLAPPEMKVERVRSSVFASLARGEDGLWERYEGRQRTAVRKAQRAGVTVRLVPGGEGMDAFVRIYTETMDRLDAAPDYYFDDAYFAGLAPLEGASVALAEVAGEPVAAAILLVVEPLGLAHYHLAGSTSEGRRTAAGNLLLHQAAVWAAANGLERLHLGGGRTGAGDDALLRFKLAIGRERRDVHVGKRVHDAPAYARLRSAWEERHGETPFFLFYRAPLQHSEGHR